jgi:hypothetical protein
MQVHIEFRPIAGYPGYWVTSGGGVWSERDGRGGTSAQMHQIKPKLNHGYLLVSLYQQGVRRTRKVAHLVLEAFVGPRPEGAEACHFPDPTRTNNRVGNLRWESHVVNMGHRELTGTLLRGEDHVNAKVTAEQVQEIRRLRREAEERREAERARRRAAGQAAGPGDRGRWKRLPPIPTYEEIGAKFGICGPEAHDICKRKAWAHVP